MVFIRPGVAVVVAIMLFVFVFAFRFVSMLVPMFAPVHMHAFGALADDRDFTFAFVAAGRARGQREEAAGECRNDWPATSQHDGFLCESRVSVGGPG
jgi:hypothetical protein